MSLFTNPRRKRQDNREGEAEAQPPTKFLTSSVTSPSCPVYACKLCDKTFLTFQALGGHRAAHKNRTEIVTGMRSGDLSKESHTCSICSQKFVSGQALSGHMRKHFIAQEEKAKPAFLKEKTLREHDWMYLASKSDSIVWENMVKDGTICDRSTLITRNFFPMEPIWSQDMPIEVVPVLTLRVERGNSWLDLKLGPPGGDHNKDYLVTNDVLQFVNGLEQ